MSIPPGLVGEQGSVVKFHQMVLETGVLDPPDRHHEFADGAHGPKLDFDAIPSGSSLYNLWVGVTARRIAKEYPQGVPAVLVGVDRGGIRLARSAAALLGDEVEALKTKKVNRNEVALTDLAKAAIQLLRPELCVVVDDVGTTGSTVASAVKALWQEGVDKVEAIMTWQRHDTMPYLDDLNIHYGAAVIHPLPNFSPEECRSLPQGYCYQGVSLIPHGE